MGTGLGYVVRLFFRWRRTGVYTEPLYSARRLYWGRFWHSCALQCHFRTPPSLFSHIRNLPPVYCSLGLLFLQIDGPSKRRGLVQLPLTTSTLLPSCHRKGGWRKRQRFWGMNAARCVDFHRRFSSRLCSILITTNSYECLQLQAYRGNYPLYLS